MRPLYRPRKNLQLLTCKSGPPTPAPPRTQRNGMPSGVFDGAADQNSRLRSGNDERQQTFGIRHNLLHADRIRLSLRRRGHPTDHRRSVANVHAVHLSEFPQRHQAACKHAGGRSQQERPPAFHLSAQNIRSLRDCGTPNQPDRRCRAENLKTGTVRNVQLRTVALLPEKRKIKRL